MMGKRRMSSFNENPNSGITFTAILVLVITLSVAGYLIYSWWLSQHVSEPIRIVECSLYPLEVDVGQNSTLKVTIENADRKTHTIKFYFSADPKVTFLKPNGEPLEKNDSSFIYVFVLESAQSTSTLQFLVNGKLGEMISFAGYPLSLEIYIDGNKITKNWQDLTLTVRKP